MTVQQAIERLRERSPLPLFVVQVWDQDLAGRLRSASPEQLFGGQPARDRRAAAGVVAGLHLWNDDFTAAHMLAQGLHDATGSYWHSLCHRREGHRGEGLAANLGNARYWNRQTGAHPAHDPVYRAALSVLDSAGPGLSWAAEAADELRRRHRWDPDLIVGWFGEADAGALPAAAQELLQEIQWREIDLLVDWCLQRALEG